MKILLEEESLAYYIVYPMYYLWLWIPQVSHNPRWTPAQEHTLTFMAPEDNVALEKVCGGGGQGLQILILYKFFHFMYKEIFSCIYMKGCRKHGKDKENTFCLYFISILKHHPPFQMLDILEWPHQNSQLKELSGFLKLDLCYKRDI